MMRRKKEHGIRKVLFLFFFIALLLFGLEEAAYRQYLKMNQVGTTKAVNYSIGKKNQMQKDHKASLEMRAKKEEIFFKDYPQKLRQFIWKNIRKLIKCHDYCNGIQDGDMNPMLEHTLQLQDVDQLVFLWLPFI